jgi:PAS domain S-box-containing protein
MTSAAMWERLLYVRSADPVRRALNRGFAIVILFSIAILALLGPVLLALGEVAAGTVCLAAIPLYVFMWHLNRRGTTYAAMIYVGYAIASIAVVAGSDPVTFAGGSTPLPLILGFAVVVAAVFIRPNAGFVAAIAEIAIVGAVLSASGDLPSGDVVRFVVVGTLNLTTLAAIVMVGATMLARAIRAETAASAALRASEERYRTLYEDSPSMHFTIDADGIVVSVNEFGASQLGYEAGEMLGSSAYDMYVPSERGRAAGHIAACLRESGRNFHWEIDKSRKDSSILTVSETAKAVTDNGGAQVVLVVSEDITEQRRAEFERLRLEMELRQAHKLDAIGRLAGGTAHDFNNLLTVISGYTQVLDKQLAGHPAHGDVQEMSQAVKSAMELTRQLLAFSRRQEVRTQMLDLNEIVSDMCRLLKRIIGEDVELETDLEPELGRLTADRNQLEQVILNLSVNARDAMPAGGRLILATANVVIRDAADAAAGCPELAPGSYVALSVADTGIGMDVEIRDRAFEPFFTTKEVGSGTGLGLSTVSGIVTKSGGMIAVRSRPDEGTTFTVYLPRTAAPTAASTATEVTTSGAG